MGASTHSIHVMVLDESLENKGRFKSRQRRRRQERRLRSSDLWGYEEDQVSMGFQREGLRVEGMFSGAVCCGGRKWHRSVWLPGGLMDCIQTEDPNSLGLKK